MLDGDWKRKVVASGLRYLGWYIRLIAMVHG